jgi:ribosomal-protein-alanine N-acetyltransferase
MLLEVDAHNEAALAFYRRHGFLEISRRPGYYRAGTDAVVLARDLPPPRIAGNRLDPSPST